MYQEFTESQENVSEVKAFIYTYKRKCARRMLALISCIQLPWQGLFGKNSEAFSPEAFSF